MIYVSYSPEDRPIVQRFCHALTEKGVQLYVDYEEQLAGENYALELTKQIESAEVILFFYSENAENSIWVKHEIEFSLSKKKCIIPLLLSEPGEDSWIHYYLGSFNWIKENGESINSVADRILNALSPLCKKERIDPTINIDAIGLPIPPQSNKPEEHYIPTEPISYKNKSNFGCGIIMIIALLLFFVLYYIGSSNSSSRVTKSDSNMEMESSLGREPIMKIPDGHGRECFAEAEEDCLERIDEMESTLKDAEDSNNESFQSSQADNKQSGKNEDAEEDGSNNGTSIWLLMLISFLFGCGLMFLLLRVRKPKKNIKLSSDIASKISIDGDLKKEIGSREVYTTYLDRGEYLIDFEDKQDANRHKIFNYEVTTKECKLVFANFIEESSQKGKTIKCFIAGSKTLQQERDALRAVTCVMYNKWDSMNFRILSYTFEDFNKEHTHEPPQELYNRFIEKEADWALFIIDGEVGGITVNEYRVAMDSFKKNGSPKILALAKVGSENNEKVAEIKNEINKEHQYWSDYTDIVSLKYIFESALNWNLIGIYQNK